MKNNNICFETPINSKITDSFLINLTRAPPKKTQEATLHLLGNCLLLDTHSFPPSEFPLHSVGRVDIFWNYTKKMTTKPKPKAKRPRIKCNTFTFDIRIKPCSDRRKSLYTKRNKTRPAYDCSVKEPDNRVIIIKSI